MVQWCPAKGPRRRAGTLQERATHSDIVTAPPIESPGFAPMLEAMRSDSGDTGQLGEIVAVDHWGHVIGGGSTLGPGRQDLAQLSSGVAA